MISKEENDLLTRTGPGTPSGELMRRYWQPAALSEELPPAGAPLPMKLLGEALVLFRDDQGRPGLLDLHCPHRGADLSYGRLEDGGAYEKAEADWISAQDRTAGSLFMRKRARVVAVFIGVAAHLFCLGSLGSGAESKSQRQVEWERTVKAAKKEGQVNIYMSGWFAILDSGAFQKAYPEIKIVGITGQGFQITQRILSERRAGKYLADVVSAGVPFPYPQLHRAKVFDPIRPALILSEVVDESQWYQGKHRYADAEKEYVFIYAGVPQTGGVSYNTKLVSPQELRSFWDFVNPKWKGKIIARDIRVPGPGSGAMRFFYHHPELGPKFIRKLFGEMEVTLFRDFRQGPDWLATGRFALCFFCSVDTAKRQGLTVDTFKVMKEGAGLVSQFGGLGLVNMAPHPNAAKVFINWFLSREGQLTLQRVIARSEGTVPDSLRIDIPKDDVPPEDRRVRGVNYLDLDSHPEWIEMEPILKVFEEALAQAKKKG